MQITAKFASNCPSCGGPISEGSRVEWEKGQKARHVTCPGNRPLRLIPAVQGPSTGMDTKTAPLFPVASFPARTPEENVKLLGTVAHVCEVKGSYALVHASPVGVGRIAQELSLEVYPSRQGGEYYAVRVARSANVALVRSAPVVDDCQVLPQRSVPQAPASAPRRTVVSKIGSTLQLEFKGQDYQVKETTCKRRCDVRRWEVRKLDGTLSDPYVVTFQDAHGDSTACSCPDAIYRKRFCKHQAGIKAAFGYKEQGQVLAG